MELLKELISDLVDDSKQLSNILRKAKIFASIYKIPEMQQWIKAELEGYSEKVKLPSYRLLYVGNIGYFQGPFGSAMKNVTLPTYNLPEPLKDYADHCYIYQSVSEVESMVETTNTNMERKWPAEYIALAQEYIQASGGMVLVDAKQPISRSLLVGIIDNVKNKLLDYLLDLDQNNIILEGIEMNEENRKKARQKFEVNVYGNNNNIASGTNFTQNISGISKNDLDGLLSYFRENKIEETDLQELKNSIQTDETENLSDKTFGQKVSKWIGKMITKAANGTWNIGLQIAPSLITNALNAFFGF